MRAMRLFRCLLPALTLAFLGAGNIQSQNYGTGAASNQPVASAQTVAYCDFLEQVLNPFRCQSSLNLDWDLCAINRTCLKYGIAAIR
jgi:hypothetical protein